MMDQEHEVRRRGFNFSIVPHDLIRDRSLSIQARYLYSLYLSFASKEDGKAFPRESHLCEICRIGPKLLRKFRAELDVKGWVDVERYRDPKTGRFGRVIVWVNEKPEMSIKSTTGTTTTGGDSIGGNATGPNPKPLATTPNNTHTPTPRRRKREEVCVLPDGVMEQIEAQIERKKAMGKLQDEDAYRATLVNAWRKGEFVERKGSDGDESSYERTQRYLRERGY